MKIHKQPLLPTHRQQIDLPGDATILTVQPQHGRCCIWYSTSGTCDTLNTHDIICAFTGDEIDDNLTYLGTCQFHSGHTVVHVFEEFPI